MKENFRKISKVYFTIKIFFFERVNLMMAFCLYCINTIEDWFELIKKNKITKIYKYLKIFKKSYHRSKIRKKSKIQTSKIFRL